MFKKLGVHACVNLGIETPIEESVRRYTPGLPRVAERLKTATALRRFGIEVNLQVSPVLPYGDWRTDAPKFAELLAEHGDHVYVKSITDGTAAVERRIRSSALAVNLARDRKFHWLRPDSATPLITALEAIAPQKLAVPQRKHMQERQVRMFAA